MCSRDGCCIVRALGAIVVVDEDGVDAAVVVSDAGLSPLVLPGDSPGHYPRPGRIFGRRCGGPFAGVLDLDALDPSDAASFRCASCLRDRVWNFPMSCETNARPWQERRIFEDAIGSGIPSPKFVYLSLIHI